jgi:hypothetical protein
VNLKRREFGWASLIALFRNAQCFVALMAMRTIIACIVILFYCGPAAAFGFSSGGSGREYSYPNEPQYQYPGKEMRRCPKNYAPYKGVCRKIRWVR